MTNRIGFPILAHCVPYSQYPQKTAFFPNPSLYAMVTISITLIATFPIKQWSENYKTFNRLVEIIIVKVSCWLLSFLNHCGFRLNVSPVSRSGRSTITSITFSLKGLKLWGKHAFALTRNTASVLIYAINNDIKKNVYFLCHDMLFDNVAMYGPTG